MRTQKPASHPAKLVALHADIQPTDHALEAELCLIGRADLCQIIMPDKIVSRIQAVIERDTSGCYILRDTDSANGTYVNGKQIHEAHPLADQDEIGLGRATAHLRFEATHQTTPKTDHQTAIPRAIE